jgi:hypothetical protein
MARYRTLTARRSDTCRGCERTTEPGETISERTDRNYRDRIWNTMGRGVEDARKADEMRSKAANIEAAANAAIYDDDPDAVERLQAKIEGLVAERARITAFNASCRKGTPDEGLLDEFQRSSLANLRRVCPYQVRPNGALPAYWAGNLSGQISKLRQRLERLERRAS